MRLKADTPPELTMKKLLFLGALSCAALLYATGDNPARTDTYSNNSQMRHPKATVVTVALSLPPMMEKAREGSGRGEMPARLMPRDRALDMVARMEERLRNQLAAVEQARTKINAAPADAMIEFAGKKEGSKDRPKGHPSEGSERSNAEKGDWQDRNSSRRRQMPDQK